MKCLPKRIILSRKGFDQAAGGCPSPILQDGTLMSIPIPGDYNSSPGIEHTRFEDLGSHAGLRLPKSLGSSLKIRRLEGHVHLDPDIRPDLRPRKASRQCADLMLFGQCDAAQKHLENQGIDQGDLFVFFGLFRDATLKGGSAKFVRSSTKRHVIWGWLQVGQIHRIPDGSIPKALRHAKHHPHLQFRKRANNCIYAGTPALTFLPDLPGAGTFTKFADALCLTTKGEKLCSDWTLPAFFGKAKTTYLKTESWKRYGNTVRGYSPGRGQEFVALIENCQEEAGAWLSTLFKEAKRKG